MRITYATGYHLLSLSAASDVCSFWRTVNPIYCRLLICCHCDTRNIPRTLTKIF
ncbi:hypothetical protein KCP77_14940 [Salmonella enterica subsp. enterica]|nr:hypothetical protein KCP77_14940 [Salmonella enterica subsp. enterica]